jgi:Tfp pilus assembly protein PilX
MTPSSSERPHIINEERGVALVVALLSMLLLSALGVGLMMTTTTESMIATNYRDGGEALYAADAGIERVMQDLLTVPDWNRLLAQDNARTSFTDGADPGNRTLPDGSSFNLLSATNMLNCGKTAACTIAEMNAWSKERPWSANNPRWRLIGYSPIADIIETGTVLSQMYVAVWIADDQAETDADPTQDANGVLLMRAVALGPGGASSVVEITLGRTDTTELERGYTGQRGQDEQNRRARKAHVGTPGQALGRSTMTATDGGFQTQ